MLPRAEYFASTAIRTDASVVRRRPPVPRLQCPVLCRCLTGRYACRNIVVQRDAAWLQQTVARVKHVLSQVYSSIATDRSSTITAPATAQNTAAPPSTAPD